MIIQTARELEQMQQISNIVATTLQQMISYTKEGMTTKEIDLFGERILKSYGANSAPSVTYNFPGCTCISVNNEMAHGIPSDRILQKGDVLNIDVSAELNGYFADNGASIVIGEDIHSNQKLVNTSIEALYKAISVIKGGVKINEVGRIIEKVAKSNGFKVINNLGGHGIGKSLHEEPDCILNYFDRSENRRFRKGSVVAIETFISTNSTSIYTAKDGWTFLANNGGYCAQHEHTILVTDSKPIILTAKNGIFKDYTKL